MPSAWRTPGQLHHCLAFFTLLHPCAGALDLASEDELSEIVWAVRTEATEADGLVRVTVRSLRWPGYFFSADVDTPTFGSVYWGDGVESKGLCFML